MTYDDLSRNVTVFIRWTPVRLPLKARRMQLYVDSDLVYVRFVIQVSMERIVMPDVRTS